MLFYSLSVSLVIPLSGGNSSTISIVDFYFYTVLSNSINYQVCWLDHFLKLTNTIGLYSNHVLCEVCNIFEHDF